MARLYLADETEVVDALIARARPSAAERAATEALARDLVQRVRAQRQRGGLDAFLHQYALSTEEGVVLMCLAEALLRVPDAETQDKLIKDKIGSAHWNKHLGQSSSLFVNASTWALMLTGSRRQARRRCAGLDLDLRAAWCNAAASRSSVRR